MPDSKDLLIELGMEELPPKALPALSRDFASLLVSEFESLGLAHGNVLRFATPRRLAVVIERLATRQPDREIERRGPPVRIAFDGDGKPTKAAEKFASGLGVEVSALDRLETEKGEWLVYRGTETGRDAAELIGQVIDTAVDKLPVPRRMRWGASDAEFVRPVHWVVVLFGNDTVPAEVFGIKASNETRGHRFHAPGAIVLSAPSDYEVALEKTGRVIASFDTRRTLIEKQVRGAADAAGGTAIMRPGLLDEVTALVEWPVALTGHFEEKFLELPREVLIATLESHQRYFAIENSAGDLTPAFITIANIDSTDPDEVRRGNERVIRPRLADAAFFYDADRKTPLANRIDSLKAVVFQRKLGSVHDKSERVRALAERLAGAAGADGEATGRAAILCKCDLVTDMVGEFPELQGTMGRYYAAHDGEPASVSMAIGEHYAPRFAGDELPSTAEGRALSIADKIDTVVAIFAAGLKPTGNRDPFGLRRQALGALRIVIEKSVDIDLRETINRALESLPRNLCGEADLELLESSVYEFMMERLRSWYLDSDAGITPEMFDAVYSRKPARPLDFHRRIEAVSRFMQLDAAASLSAANKRIVNILRKADDAVTDSPDASRFAEPAEKGLFEEMTRLSSQIEPLIASGDHASALTQLAELKEPVDQFFDDVMVMAEDDDVRRNRLALLGHLRNLFLHTADISRLQISQ